MLVLMVAMPVLAQEDDEQRVQEQPNDRQQAGDEETVPPGVATADTTILENTGLFFDCQNTPEAGIRANVTKLNYYGRLTNTVKATKDGSVSTTFNWGYDNFRRQEKTVETRSARGTYRSGKLLPFTLSMDVGTDWSEDLTVNSSGNENQNKRKTRRAGVNASKSQLYTGPLVHSLTAGWFYNDQEAINQEQRNDFDNGEFSGALRSGVPLTQGIRLATRLYGLKRDGNSLLADFESPSSTTGDTLGAGVYYKRSRFTGLVTVSQASFDRNYLDYRRDSNGLIDTTNLDPGMEKVVQELEKKDALDLKWDNTLNLGRLKLVSKLSHKTSSQDYAVSGVGLKEKSEDLVDLALGMAVSRRDSLTFKYQYKWSWDDQTFSGGTAPRGKQYKKNRDFSFIWDRDLFTRTTFQLRYNTNLSQDIAENEFNENDRDRLSEDLSGKLSGRFGWFTTSLLASYQNIDDVAIRATRSANNNSKGTYEVAPKYTIKFSDRLTLSQTFRMYIQFQDYFYSELEGSSKEDTYNKRGNLGTTVTYKPNERLSITAKHAYNKKYNGNRTNTDAAGNDYYRKVQGQTLNRIDLAFSYYATDWLTLDTATYRTKDTVDRFSATNSISERYSGELWVGAIIDRSWGPPERPLVLQGGIKRYLAYGPNVTDTSSDYWEADVLMRWMF